MRYKIMMLAIFLVSLLAVSAVSAAENATEDIIADVASEDVVSVENNNQTIEQTENEEISTADDGTFTALQNKINNAESGSTIILENDYIYDDGFDTNGISIKFKQLTINGNGHILNGLSKSRILIMSNVHDLIIKNVKFKNGYSVDADLFKDDSGQLYTHGNGGAIYFSTSLNSGLNLHLIDCEFDNNVAKDGGAIYGESGNILISGASPSITCIIDNCIFTNNVASYDGGAICDSSYDDKNWQILNCKFDSNNARNGGGIYSTINNLQVIDSKFNKNSDCAIKIAQSKVNNQFKGGSYTNVSNCEFTYNSGCAISWGGTYGNLESSTFKYNTGGTAKDVYWYGEHGTISNCKSYTQEDKGIISNIYVSGDANETTSVNGFDVIVVKSTQNSQSSSSSSSNKVTKTTPKLTAKAKTFKKSVKTKKYTITLKNNKNKAISKVKVTLKVNGKTYKATTNTKGQATFKITKLTKKGKHTAVVKFAGNKYYNAKTAKAKIIVK